MYTSIYTYRAIYRSMELYCAPPSGARVAWRAQACRRAPARRARAPGPPPPLPVRTPGPAADPVLHEGPPASSHPHPQSRTFPRTRSGACRPRPPLRARGRVVGCKIPWTENSLISRGIGDFSIYPARACLFWVHLAKSWNQPDFFYPERLFLIHRGVNLGWTRGNGKGGGAKKIETSASFLFEVSCSPRRPRSDACLPDTASAHRPTSKRSP